MGTIDTIMEREESPLSLDVRSGRDVFPSELPEEIS